MATVATTVTPVTLPSDRLEYTEAWGQAAGALNYVYRPTTVDDLREIFALARRTGRSVGLRGAGRSYGDAAYNAEGILIDFARMNRILAWDPKQGIITMEPGVTIEQLWRYALGDGWWPPVVPGTMTPTIGGVLGMNVHGKNNWKAGTTGDNVLKFTALLPTGEEVTCSREENRDLFYSIIGGFGMLGVFTSITLKLKKVYSGELKVDAYPVPNIEAVVADLDAEKDKHDYVVAWVDCFPGGKALGRSEVHVADYLKAGEDPAPAQTLRLEHQDLPDTIMGFFPKSIVWMGMWFFLNNPGAWLTNTAKFMVAQFKGRHSYRQSYAAFNFLLDYVPHWKKAYLPGGLIQYQSFIPKDKAAATYRKLIEISHKYGTPSYLAVMKRHRPDEFLMTHAVDGYSLAMDFKVTKGNRNKLVKMAAAMDAVVLAAGGRFYFAKDSTLHPESARAYLGEDTLAKFVALKRRCDPDNLLQTSLARRVLPELFAGE